ncbi:MAG: metallophosphoesterase [Chloroflexota bacterium]
MPSPARAVNRPAGADRHRGRGAGGLPSGGARDPPVPGERTTALGLRFLHAADLHLDSPFRGLTAVAPAPIAAQLAEATVGAWGRIVALAIAERVDCVVVAGDVFESESRTIRAQLAFADGLWELDRAGIASFVVTGNHDPLSGWEASVALPPSCRRFGADAVEVHPLVRDGVEIAHIHGISYPRRDVRENLAARFRALPGGPFSIGLLHANVGGRPEHEDYAPCSVADLVASGIDYWALGHIHRPALVRADAPTVVYPGNPQGRDFGETEPRGVVLATVGDDRRVHVEQRTLDAIRWTERTIGIGGLASLTHLAEAIEEEADGARRAAGRPTIVRIRLEGTGTLHDELRRDPGGLAALVERVNARSTGWAPWAWIAAVTDRTRAAGTGALAGADDLLAELDRVIGDTGGALRAGTDDPAGIRAALEALAGRDGLRDAIGAFTPDDLDAIAVAARARIADELARRD